MEVLPDLIEKKSDPESNTYSGSSFNYLLIRQKDIQYGRPNKASNWGGISITGSAGCLVWAQAYYVNPIPTCIFFASLLLLLLFEFYKYKKNRQRNYIDVLNSIFVSPYNMGPELKH